MAQPVQPGAQQGRGLHVGGKHALRGAHEGLDAQASGPIAHGLRPEGFEERAQAGGTRAIAAHEGVEWLGMGEVQAALAGEQEFAAHRRHGIEHVHVQAGAAHDFGRHQAGRAAADDGHADVRRERVHGKAVSSPAISMSRPCVLMKARRTGSPGFASAIAAP